MIPPVSLDTTPAGLLKLADEHKCSPVSAFIDGCAGATRAAARMGGTFTRCLACRTSAVLRALATSSPPAPQVERVWNCRFHPTDWWHEVGCPHHRTWTPEELAAPKPAFSTGWCSHGYPVCGQCTPVAPAVPDHAGLVKLIDAAYQETRTVFADVGGDTSPYHAAGQAADYMRESLLAALRPTGGETHE